MTTTRSFFQVVEKTFDPPVIYSGCDYPSSRFEGIWRTSKTRWFATMQGNDPSEELSDPPDTENPKYQLLREEYGVDIKDRKIRKEIYHVTGDISLKDQVQTLQYRIEKLEKQLGQYNLF